MESAGYTECTVHGAEAKLHLNNKSKCVFQRKFSQMCYSAQ